MFKTLLRINKEVVISFALTFGALLFLVLNALTLIQSLITVYKTERVGGPVQTINAKSVNDAIEVLSK